MVRGSRVMVIRGFFSSRLKASSVQGSIEASSVQGSRLRIDLSSRREARGLVSSRLEAQSNSRFLR